jgi:hypothetical protein
VTDARWAGLDAGSGANIMILVSSTLRREGRWVSGNYALLNAVGLALGIVHGTVLMATSTDGSIPGWTGSPVEQVIWYAVEVVVFLPLIFGLPALILLSAVWRAAIAFVGHPRIAAYGIAAVAVVSGLLLIPRPDFGEMALAAAAVIAFATIVRPPVARPGEPRPVT